MPEKVVPLLPPRKPTAKSEVIWMVVRDGENAETLSLHRSQDGAYLAAANFVKSRIPEIHKIRSHRSGFYALRRSALTELEVNWRREHYARYLEEWNHFWLSFYDSHGYPDGDDLFEQRLQVRSFEVLP